MSIVTPAERDEWWCPKGPCLLCSREIPRDQPAVMWAGTTEIILHFECAQKLGVHLIGDAREAQMATGKHWWKRGLRAVRAALIGQEQKGA